jgi:protein SCO1/2
MKKAFPILIIAAVIALIIAGVMQLSSEKPLRLLPYYGPKKIDSIQEGGKWLVDTTFHQVKPFSFIDQKGNTITDQMFKDKIYVTDYFFCTCQSICPIMTKQMARIAKQFENDTDVLFLSHTVNPEHDSVNVLADYAQLHGVKYGQWYLVTGDKPALYKQARESYMLDASEGDGGVDDFIHTENFALIDPNKNIRGYYDGTDSLAMEQLMKDIGLLKKEIAFNRKIKS